MFQIQADFLRLTNVSLSSTFYMSIDAKLDVFLDLVKSGKQGRVASNIKTKLGEAPQVKFHYLCTLLWGGKNDTVQKHL